jgi:glycogen(starch) synthase
MRKLGVAEHVTFLDWVSPDRVLELMNKATLVIVPSRWPEPFGLVALEAAMMGRPVVASAVGGLPEIVEHGVSGLLVPPNDHEALAAAVDKILRDPSAARLLGPTARQRARAVFDFAAFVDAYEQSYATVLAMAAARGETAVA